MRVYGIFIKQGDANFIKASEKDFAEEIKRNNGGAVLSGFDMSRYIGCIVFKKREERDRVAQYCEKIDLDIDTRDDGVIDYDF